MSIRLKLLVGCLCLTLVTLVLGGFAQFSQREVGTLATRIYDEALLSLSYLRAAQNSLVELRSDYRYRLAEAPSRREELGPAERAELYEGQLADILADLQVAAERAISPAAREKTAQLKERLTELRNVAPQLDPFIVLDTLSQIDAEFDTAVEIFAGDGFSFRREVVRLIEASVRHTGMAAMAAVALAIVISVVLSGMIVPPLNRAVGIAKAIAGGKLDNEIAPSGRSETSELLSALAKMQEGISDQLRRIHGLMAAQAHRYDSHIALQNSRFEAALNNMSQGLCMFDESRKLVVFNRRFAQMFGGLKLGVEADRVLIDPSIPQLLAPGRAGSLTHELPDGRVISMSRQMISEGGWVDTFEDITERRKAEVKLNHLALHDALTGLPNRVQFRDRLEKTLARPEDRMGTAVLCLDLDGFKSVNDTLGHPLGDVLLKAAAERLLCCVGNGGLVARLGGDEFAIIVTAEDPATAAERLARSVIEELGKPYDLDGQPVAIGVSIGIILGHEADGPDAGAAADRLIKNGDLALYRAKSEGRSTYRFFEPEMDERLQERRKMELDLRTAIDREELELFYQPFVDVDAGAVSGFEALLRWRHPEHGFVSPGVFVPLAEESGLIMQLGAWVLETACRQAAGWPEELKVSVNLSAVQFRNRGLIDEVRRALEAAGLAPERLQLEVTESLLIHDTEAVLKTLNAFRELGIQISMDDFGTGYSSLGYISKFPFDKIKIDQSFVRNIENSENLAIIRAVIGLSRALDIAVIAEGVETAEQLDVLRSEGCTEMQGYYFARPQPATDLASVLLRLSRGLPEAQERAGSAVPSEALALTA